MTEQSHLPIEDKIKAAVRAVEPNSRFSDSLWQQISQKQVDRRRTLLTGSGFFRALRLAALALPVIALVILIIGPQKVVTAFSSLFGYLPGAGFVEDAPSTLYLAEPIIMEQEGVKLTVEQVVADRNNVIVTYQFIGLPEGSPCFFDDNTLRLPDGKIRLPIGGGVSGAQAHIYYQPLPEGVRTLTLLVSQGSPDPNCRLPQNWSVDIVLGPLPAGTTLVPVAQGQDLQVSTQTVIPAAEENAAEVNDVHFIIDKVAELADAYVVSGHVTGSNPAWNDIFARPEYIRVSDANGRDIPIEQADDDVNESGGCAFKLAKGSYANPLTIEFQSVQISALFDEGDSFTFDATTQPQVGQTWDIQQNMNVLGHEVMIESVSAIHDDEISNDPQFPTGYVIQIKTDADVLSLDFFATGSLAAGNGPVGGSVYRNPDGTQKLELTYPEGLPTGIVTYRVRNLQYFLNGSWQLQLQLPSPAQ
ncbi:MAG TPA: hypothetical protein VHP14_11265 [Anaerolineales bacterium]|nr:hypothetical protein [Anaerolineales bacterium]